MTPLKGVSFLDAGEIDYSRHVSMPERAEAPAGPSVAPAAPAVAGARPKLSFASTVEEKVRKGDPSVSISVFHDGQPDLATIRLIYKLMAAQHFEANGFRTLLWKFLLSTMLLLAVVGFACCLVMLGVYLRLHPVVPDVQLLGLGISSMSVGEVDDATKLLQQHNGKYFGYVLSYEFAISYVVLNANARVEIHVEYVEATLLYSGFVLSTTTTSPFRLPRMSNLTFSGTMVRQDMDVPLTVGYNLYHTMLSTSPFTFVVNLQLYGRISTVGSIRSPPFYSRTRCQIDLNDFSNLVPACERMNASV